MLLSYVKRGAYNTFIYGISSIFIKIISFLFMPFFLSRLSLIEFGIWDFYQLFFSHGTLMVASCAAISLTRFYLLYKNDEVKQYQALGNAFLLSLISAFLVPIISVVLWHLGIITCTSEYLILTCVSISSFGLFSMVLAYHRVLENLWIYLALFCGQNVIAIGGTLIGIMKGIGIKAFFYANLMSFLLFLPLFFQLFFKHCHFSKKIFKEQVFYSAPLLLYSLMYAGFFSIDRLVIQQYLGYETLGIYGLLWKFGCIFQIASTAMIDASPVIFYNAQKESNSDFLIAKLISYFCLTMTSFCLMALFASWCTIIIIFPIKYHFILTYLPLFFLSLVILEIARIFQTGFGLSLKTYFIPILSLLGLSLQAGLVSILKLYGLTGILAANSIAFLFYAILNYVCSGLYTKVTIDRTRVLKLSEIFIVYIFSFSILFAFNAPWYALLVLLLSWPYALSSSNAISIDEKLWFKAYVHKIIAKLSTKKDRVNVDFSTILYLRTDICSQEIKTGGSITHTLGVIKGFIDSGSTIICASSAMPSILKVTKNITFLPLKVWPIFCCMRWKLGYLRWHLDSFFSTFFFAWQTKKLFKSYKITCIYQRYSLLNFTGVLLSRIMKLPLLLEYNGSEVWAFKNWGEKRFLHLFGIAKIVELINLHAADYITVVSQALKDDLLAKKIDTQKILINPNGVDVDHFNSELLIRQRTALHTQLALEDKFVFGFIGTFSYWHGIEVLASMIPEVIKKEPRAHFLLIGDGPLKNYLVQVLLKDDILHHVTFSGQIPHSKAREFLASCDVFISPTQTNADGTRFFGSPTKLFEYLSMAKPIIASDLEQLSEVLSPSFKKDDLQKNLIITNQIGFLLPPSEPLSFVEAACLLMNLHHNDLLKMGNNARKKAVEQYTWNMHVLNIQKFTQSQQQA